MRPLDVRHLGVISYAEGLALQAELVQERRAGNIPDTLLLLQHPHVLTVGVKKDGRANILAPPDRLDALGVDVFDTGRGGDVTYHGPGQIVGYPILDLNPDRRDVHRYVRDLEEVMIRVCGVYGVEAGRVQGLTGAWVTHPRAGPGKDRGDRRPHLPLDHEPRLRLQRLDRPQLLRFDRALRHRRPRGHFARARDRPVARSGRSGRTDLRGDGGRVRSKGQALGRSPLVSRI